MKKNRIITVLVSLLSSMTLLATTYEYNGFTFDIDVASQTATLMQKSSGNYSGNIIVPETFVGPKDIEYTVTAIGSNAFYGCSGMTSVSMPVTVESIGTSAFYNCTALTTIAIPRLVDHIGESAFSGCYNLSSIELPYGVTYIARYLFNGCSNLASVTFGQQVTAIGDYAFQNCTKLASLPLPSRLETIGSYAFSGCSALASLTLPASVTSVGSYAFSNCSAMSKLILANSLQTIGESAFYNTSSLSVLKIPASVTSIGNNAFSGCGAKQLVYADGCTIALRTYATAITSVSLPSSLMSIADRAFYDCTQLAAVTLPNSLKSIGASAFYNCATLPSVSIPASVSSIGTDAFARSGVALLEYADGCTTALRTYATGITSVVIPVTVSSFADGVFSGCNSLENVLIFNVEMWNHLFSKLTSNPFPVGHRLYVNGNLLTALNADFGRDVSNYAFYGCKGLRQVNLTGSITGVQSYAFTQCPDLESVAIASSVGFIGQDAFQGCSSLSSVRMGDGVKTIGKNAFYACPKLNSVSMGNGVTQIGESAFKGCSSLPRLELPATLTSIGQEAFSGCHELASIEIPAGVSLIADRTFYDCKNLQQAVLSDAVTSIGSYAFYGCKRLRTMQMPNVTATFSERCFSDCDSLRYIYLGTGVNSISSYSFANCKSLTGFYIGTVTPPSCQSSAFSGSDPEYASLYVPDESVSLYSNKSPWSSFGTKTGQSSAPVYVTSITLSQPVVIIEEGDIFNLTATVHPSNATNTKVNWTSSNTAVAYVNSKGSGLANVEGRTTITATAADNNGASAKSTVIVSNSFVPLSTVTLSADSVWLAEGKELQLTAGLEPAGATFNELTWSSSDPQVAIVNSVGLIKALKAGEAVITCAAGDGMGAQDVCKITVTEAVDPAIGDANEDGDVSVADLAYAVHVIMEELANGADISLYDIDGDGEITIDDVLAIADMILGRSPETVIKLLEFSADNMTIGIAETQQLSCLVIPYRYSQLLEWSSSAPEVVSVDDEGHVTGLVAGSAIITVTATDGSGLSAKCKVTVDGSYGTTDGHSWVDLGLPSGTHWATQNLGALSSSEYGGYYAWGETAVKENYSWATYAHCDGSATTLTKYCNAASKGTRDDLLQLQPGDDAAMTAWGENWCMPTREQLDELFNPAYTTTTWTQQNGLYGRLVTSRSNGHSIFLPAAGYKNGSTLNSVGSGGYYASRDLYETNADYNYSVNFGSSTTTNDNHTYRCYGQSVRPVFAKYVTRFLMVNPKSLTLEIGAVATLTAMVVTSDGTSNSVTWSSSNKRIATVSANGTVRGISSGTVTIYARTVDGLTGSCVVTVVGCDRTFTVNGVSFKMVWVEGGTFQMGSTSGYSNERPVHSVTLSDYLIGETEVTQALWYAVMGQKPIPNSNGYQWDSDSGVGDQYPAYFVSWNDCQEFITKLNQLTGQKFRLPTEAEWEFAARGGNSSKGYTCAGSNTIEDVAWYDDNSGSKTHPVATKQSNELGIYDMSGNVWEWCQDWYSDSYYSSSPSSNPTGPSSGSHRVARGGSWWSSATDCRVAFRNIPNNIAYRYSTGGVRLVTDYAPYIQLNHKSLSLEVGSTAMLTATVFTPGGTSNVVKWASSNKSVATVSSNGIVKGITPGTATIGASTADGLKDSCLVSVGVGFSVNGVSFTMVKVEGGTFQMGTDEKPVHSVTLSSFSIGQTEVTQALWYAVMGQKPTADGKQWESTYGLGDQYPAYYVSWNDCQEFITKLNQLTGQTFRLPTEAEWEYAARGGNYSKGYTYAGSSTIDDVAWYGSNCGSKTHPVSTKQPNELGLYDMSGNVWEWCQDWYGSYSSASQTNPTGPGSGSYRVYRGGGWDSGAANCRVACRFSYTPWYRHYAIGFRLAL